jgi:hypothetical protein
MSAIGHFMREVGSPTVPFPQPDCHRTPESAVSKTFGTFLDRLQGFHQLDRFVLDECHAPLDSTPEFQPKMRQLGELMERGV